MRTHPFRISAGNVFRSKTCKGNLVNLRGHTPEHEVERRNPQYPSCAAVPLAPTMCSKKRRNTCAQLGLLAPCLSDRTDIGANWGVWMRLPRPCFAYTTVLHECWKG